MASTEYNGWSNHATWLVALHLSNTQWIDLEVRSLLETTQSGFEAANALKNFVEENTQYPDERTSDFGLLSQDLINSTLADVEWSEIVKHYLED